MALQDPPRSGFCVFFWAPLENVWRLVFSIAEQEGNVPWSCFQHTISILPLGAVNRFPRPRYPIRAPTSLHQNISRSRISVSPGTDAKHRMEIVVAIKEIDISLDDDSKNMWKISIKTFLNTRNGVNGRLYANINFVVITWLDGEIRSKTWEVLVVGFTREAKERDQRYSLRPFVPISPHQPPQQIGVPSGMMWLHKRPLSRHQRQKMGDTLEQWGIP